MSGALYDMKSKSCTFSKAICQSAQHVASSMMASASKAKTKVIKDIEEKYYAYSREVMLTVYMHYAKLNKVSQIRKNGHRCIGTRSFCCNTPLIACVNLHCSDGTRMIIRLSIK